jgi:hypothetical protein
MTRSLRAAILLVASVVLSSCGDEQAPVGRWEGYAETRQWLLAVRLQVDAGNVIHATALSMEVDGASLPERVELNRRMRQMLPQRWLTATKGKVDFSNNILRRSGGVAPLFVYHPGSKSMTFNFYARGKLTEKVKMRPVKKFIPATAL